VRTWVAVPIAIASLIASGCAGTTTTGVESPRSAGASTTGKSTTPGEPSAGGGKEGPGSMSHAEDEQFCSSHECIANFPNGRGEVVQCSDSKWSHSGGISGACADHGGEKGGASAESKPPEHPESGIGGGSEGPGSLSHSEDAQFCASHECIANFSNGHGAVVQCTDGEWSHSGGISGACSHHGGERASSASSPKEGGESTGTSSGSPLDTLNNYWSDIRDHGFSNAYNLLAPGAVSEGESQFVANEQKTHIENAKFHGEIASRSGSSATVTVLSLVTHDQEFGCRTWSGSYTMSNEGGSWRIEHAALSPQSCSG
jgi:hypothetical protein